MCTTIISRIDHIYYDYDDCNINFNLTDYPFIFLSYGPCNENLYLIIKKELNEYIYLKIKYNNKNFKINYFKQYDKFYVKY